MKHSFFCTEPTPITLRGALLLCVTLAMGGTPPPVPEQLVKLNAPLPFAYFGEVHFRDIELTPNGQWMVFVADQDVDDAFELYAARVDGSQGVVKLNTPLVSGQSVIDFVIALDSNLVAYVQQNGLPHTAFVSTIDGTQAPVQVSSPGVARIGLSPDGVWVVFSSNQDDFSSYELFAVPSDGSAPSFKLNGSFVANADVYDFTIAPSGQEVVYRSDQELVGRRELYVVPIDGSTGETKLSGLIQSSSGVSEYSLSPDGTRVVFRADATGAGSIELHSAPTSGATAPVRLNVPLAGGADVGEFQILSDSASVIFTAPLPGPQTGLFSAPIDGTGSALALHDPLMLGAGIGLFSVSPDLSRVVFSADAAVLKQMELYSISIGGTTTLSPLNPMPVPGADVIDFLIDAASSRVVYRADQDVDDAIELYSVPITGGSPAVKLNGVVVQNGDIAAAWISPDSTRVIYTGDLETPFVDELYSAPIDGSLAATKLNAPYPVGTKPTIAEVRITPDSGQVLYSTEQELENVREIFGVPLTGGLAPAKISGTMGTAITGEVFRDYQVAPDGTRVVYRADQDQDQVFELYSVPVDGSAGPTRLNAPIVPSGSVQGFPQAGPEITPDSTRVVFTARLDFATPFQLYSSPIDGSLPAIVLNQPLDPFDEVQSKKLSQDGAHVVFIAPQDLPSVNELYVVPTDGSQLPTKLNPALAAGQSVNATLFFGEPLQLSADGTRVIYIADQNSPGVDELYSVPLLGGVSQRLTEPLVGGQMVRGFLVAPAGNAVAYIANEDEPTRDDLYVVPLDDSADPTNLSSALAPAGFVQYSRDEIQFTGDGNWVVFHVASNGIDELYSAAADGSGPAFRLHPALPSNRNVNEFRTAAAGNLVVYRADQDTNGVFELYVVPADGSQAPIAVSGALVTGGDVSADYLFDGGGTRVLFRADKDTDGVNELYIVPADGSVAPIKLSGPMVSGGGVQDLDSKFTTDGSRVLYVADQEQNNRYELYVVRADGSAQPTKLNGPMISSGRVLHAITSPQTERVLYLADQEFDGAFELYAVAIAPVLQSASPSSGPAQGGTRITLTGLGFTRGTQVSFGGIAVEEVNWISATQLEVVTPPRPFPTALPTSGVGSGRRARLSPVSVDVVVSESGSTSKLSNGFRYRALR